MLLKWILIEAPDLQYIDEGHELDTCYGGHLCHMKIKLSCSISKFSQQIFHLTLVCTLATSTGYGAHLCCFTKLNQRCVCYALKFFFPFDLNRSSDL